MDPLVRHQNDPPPLIPGTTARFRWPEAGDPDVARIRERVQERGRSLFVLRLPMGPLKVLAEAYYPDELRPAMWEQLDPARRSDWQNGRLVVLATIPVQGSLRIGQGKGGVYAIHHVTDPMLDEIRRNNRNARQDLKRHSSASARKLALEDAVASQEKAVYDEWSDLYEAAYRESLEYALGKPRVSMYSGGSQ